MKRTLEPKLVAYFEERLAAPLFAKQYRAALDTRDARFLFRIAAESLQGIREHGGNNRGPLVELLQETVGGADLEPWCMSLVQSCLGFVEQKLGVVSPVVASEHCLTVWNETPREQRVKLIPLPGAIIIWRHGDSSSGHTGVTVGEISGRTFPAIEGNTESGIVGGKVERDGGGVYLTQRSLDGAGSMRLVGFLKPF